jgi:sec-independent protein translocase protein TatA
MGNLGFTEILLILLVVVLLFGGRKIPELMKGLGQGMREFKKASQTDDEPEKKDTEKEDTQKEDTEKEDSDKKESGKKK